MNTQSRMFDDSMKSLTSETQSSMEELRMQPTDPEIFSSEKYLKILFQYFAFQSLQNMFCGTVNNGSLHLELLKIEFFQSR